MIKYYLAKLSAGDTMVFHPGVYKGPFILKGINGLPNYPIVLMGTSGSFEMAIIDGKSEPGMDLQNNAFQMENCSWIVIEGFSIRNCWTDIITSVDVSYLSVKQCDVMGGKRLLFAKGRKSHHYLIEKCRWEQDFRVWTHEDGYTWEELHHGRYRHFNGSIFQGERISGVFVLRNNQIKNTFNAFRLSPVGDGKLDLLASSNGEIYNNLIINTSDNVLEPEVYCHNLYFYHNRLINGHAFISVTDVGGGPIYLFGNTGLSEPDCEDGWAIYKISSKERTMSEPFYIFNNSWYVDYNITGKRMGWWNDHIVHFNNAYYFEGIDTFGILTSGENSYYNNDCSSAEFPDFMNENGFESDGTKLVLGPAFKFSLPGVEIPFIEYPRITKYKIDSKRLILWLSMPMDCKQVIQSNPVLHTETRSVRIKLESVEDDGYYIRFILQRDVDQGYEPVLVLSGWPLGMNGMMMTSWASALAVIVEK